MVCKEEILPWFKDLDSFKRIDVLCEFLDMCMPFELRFVGSYIEELGKHSYQELRQPAFAANDVDKLDKDPTLKILSLYNQDGRHRLLVNVALLKSRNYNAANWYSKNFLRTEYIEDLVTKEKADETIQNELLMLYTMASRHPAFTFEQKLFFNRVLVHLLEMRESRLSTIIRAQQCRYPPGFEAPNPYRKVQENSPFPVGYPTYHPPGLPPQQLDFSGQFRAGWPPAITCGAPEIPPFPQPLPLQPPPPSKSPLVTSPNQSRSGSPRLPMRASPLMPPPIEANPSQYDDANCTLKAADDSSNSSASSSKTLNPWSEGGGKQINGLRVGPAYAQAASAPPPCNARTSLPDQMQAMGLVEETNTHYHSSSSSSPLQTPPDTPSSLMPIASSSNCIVAPHRGGLLEKNRATSGMPHYMPPFPGVSENRTSPPPQNAFTYPAAFTPMPRFFANANFRPPSSVFGQFAQQQQQPPAQSFQQQPPGGGGGSESGAVATPPYQYSVPYLSFLYSSFPPLPPPASTAPHPGAPVRNPPPPPGCFNCGAPGHLGQDCTQHNIDDIIMQKNVYSVEFNSDNSDVDK